MVKNENNLMFISSIFVSCLVVTVVIASKVVVVGGLVLPAAVFVYAITFLCTDIVSDIWGKDCATRLVKIGMFSQIIALILFYIATKLPPAFDFEYAAKFDTVLSSSFRIVLAALASYFVSQNVDIILFHFLRDKTKGKKKWIRSNFATLISQFLDTVIFITIAFGGVVPNLMFMIISQYLVKWLICWIDTPIFYFITRKMRYEEYKKKS